LCQKPDLFREGRAKRISHRFTRINADQTSLKFFSYLRKSVFICGFP
jgi:hypothetical protein